MKQEKVYIETIGCQMNVADTERAATRLRESGYEITESSHGADVVLFNTCSVRERAEQKVFTRLGEIKRDSGTTPPLIGVMGCVAQLEGEKLFVDAPSINLILGTRATDRLPALLDEVRGGKRRIIDLGERQLDDEWAISSTERHSPYVAFVPIIEGCNKFCTYCIVPYSRGRESSRPASDIVKDILQLKEEGYNEVHLIGQNVNSYRPRGSEGMERFSGATPFSRLLRAVAATGMPRIKFTTSFPRDFHSDIVAAMDEHENLCNWIHLPVQSGSDRILRAMRRGYTATDYLRRIDVVKAARRRYSLTSDIIVGFPGETEEDFGDTIALVEACQFDSLYIFKYSERSRTPAAKLTDTVSEAQKTARFLLLQKLQDEIQRKILTSYLGSTLSVLIEGRSAKSEHDLTGHSTCHKVLNFPGPSALAGQICSVTVSEAKAHSLYGQLEIAH
jgi:tRNA-2-methylthio-N6-dimethylallyladenosine synthase